uniref:Uncharacterized protein n=1 Tax=Arundo donax TaxID=35708 RepID=A0A0A9D4L0_ARUDO
MSTGLLKTTSIKPIVLNTTTLLRGKICWVGRSPFAHSFTDAFSEGFLKPVKHSTSAYKDCMMKAASGSGKTSEAQSIRPSTGKAETVSRRARELLEADPKVLGRDNWAAESFCTARREDIAVADESDIIRAPAE